MLTCYSRHYECWNVRTSPRPYSPLLPSDFPGWPCSVVVPCPRIELSRALKVVRNSTATYRGLSKFPKYNLFRLKLHKLRYHMQLFCCNWYSTLSLTQHYLESALFNLQNPRASGQIRVSRFRASHMHFKLDCVGCFRELVRIPILCAAKRTSPLSPIVTAF